MLAAISLILLFILINGFFSCAEIAVITARKSSLKPLIEKGSHNATLLVQLQNNPEQFFSVVQIGVTLSGAAASALAGISTVEIVRPWVQHIPYLGRFSEIVAAAIVILIVSYLQLVFGELVPKALAVKYADPIALVSARLFHFLTKAARPIVNLLTRNVLFFMKPFGGKIVPRSTASEEEIKWLLKEGRDRGVFEQTEHDLIQSVFEFTDISVKAAMVPRPKMRAVPIDATKQEIIRLFREEKYSRYPVYKNNLSEIVGIILLKDLLGVLTGERSFTLTDFIKPPYFVPETMQVSRLLQEFQRKRTQMAIVVNEYGSVEGLVTMEDLVEEIVGDIRDETDDGEEKPAERLKDGSWVIDASMAVRDLQSEYHFMIPESPEYETIGGFVLSHVQAIPKAGEIIQHGDYKLTIVDMDGRRINKIKLEKKPEQPVSHIV